MSDRGENEKDAEESYRALRKLPFSQDKLRENFIKMMF